MVMSWVWAALVCASVICAAVNGRASALSAAVMQGAQSGVTLAISIAGSLCLWAGIGRAMERSGLTEKLSRLLRPVMRRLFPSTREDSALAGALSTNICANFLGLGNAATPMGINAVCEMDDKSGRATDGMIMLLVLSSTSLQLLPSTVIGLRAAKGSLSPASFLPACICATVLSTIVGITLVKLISFIEKSFVSRKNAEKCTKNKLFNRSEKVPVTDKRKSERAKNEKILRSEKL